MSNKVLWFVAGTAAGIYASVKAKRAAYRLSMPGLIDQASALGVGVRAFKSEMQDGMYEKPRSARLSSPTRKTGSCPPTPKPNNSGRRTPTDGNC